jgi:hypothetical protein
MNGMALIRARRGLLAKIARECGLSRAAVAVWDRVPAERLPEVERISGISRCDLRPDICPPPEDIASAPLARGEAA